MNKNKNINLRERMKQTHEINENSAEETNASTCDFSPAKYSIGIEDLKTLPYGEKSPQPVLKTRAELRAVMGDDPFWTAAVQWALRRGFWAIKEEVRA